MGLACQHRFPEWLPPGFEVSKTEMRTTVTASLACMTARREPTSIVNARGVFERAEAARTSRLLTAMLPAH